jgi:hypothetical protein
MNIRDAKTFFVDHGHTIEKVLADAARDERFLLYALPKDCPSIPAVTERLSAINQATDALRAMMGEIH